MLGRLSKCHLIPFCLELLEFSEERHPWESVEEKLHEIRYELLVVCFNHSLSNPPLVTSLFVPTPVLLSLPPSLSLSLSPLRFHFPLSSRLHPSIFDYLPSTSVRPTVATSLPSSLYLPLPFARLSLPPSHCPSLSRSFLSLSTFLPRSFPPFLPSYRTRYPFPHSTNPPLTFHCVFLGFSFAWTTVRISCFFRDMMRQIVKQMRAGRE